ncbi:unnamed protein product [Closterium sp. Yama58-4]|nr:unnamed protein product [Closterium sp. Yama58-4]
MDVWGPARVQGQGHERYVLLVVDDYTRYTTVFPLHSKGEVPDVLIPWIRAVHLQLREQFRTDLPVLRLHSDRGGEFSSDLLRDFCQEEGILQSFTLPASPQQNGVAERRIGLVMEVARTSMIHAAAPHFLWPFAVRYAAHQLNLWPRVSMPETSPTLRWTEKAPGLQFYHPTSRRVLSSQDITLDELVPFYRLFPCRTAPPPPPPPPTATLPRSRSPSGRPPPPSGSCSFSLSVRSLGVLSLEVLSLGVLSLSVWSLGLLILSVRSLGVLSLRVRSLVLLSLGVLRLGVLLLHSGSLSRRASGTLSSSAFGVSLLEREALELLVLEVLEVLLEVLEVLEELELLVLEVLVLEVLELPELVVLPVLVVLVVLALLVPEVLVLEVLEVLSHHSSCASGTLSTAAFRVALLELEALRLETLELEVPEELELLVLGVLVPDVLELPGLVVLLMLEVWVVLAMLVPEVLVLGVLELLVLETLELEALALEVLGLAALELEMLVLEVLVVEVLELPELVVLLVLEVLVVLALLVPEVLALEVLELPELVVLRALELEALALEALELEALELETLELEALELEVLELEALELEALALEVLEILEALELLVLVLEVLVLVVLVLVVLHSRDCSSLHHHRRLYHRLTQYLVLSLPSSTGLPLQPGSPLPAPSPYIKQTVSLTERCEPASRPASPVRAVRTGRRVPRQCPSPVLGTHTMTLRPSSVPQRVPLPSPPESSLPHVPDIESDLVCAASPSVMSPSHCCHRPLVHWFESTAASALVAELVDFVAASRLDYASRLVAESESVCPPSVGGECALGTDVLEDRQEDFECLAAAVPHLVTTLLAPEGDPDAPDIPNPRSYAEAISGP